MDLITAIKTRRSVRAFTSESVRQTDIKTVVEAGFCAPSARNLRPRHFVVVTEANKLAELSTLAPNFQRFTAGDCAVVVAGDKDIQPQLEFLLEDCAAAVQNMLLMVHGLGLGAVWCGVGMESPGQAGLIEQLDLPKNLVPIAVVVIGHPAEQPEPLPRWEAEKVHWERW